MDANEPNTWNGQERRSIPIQILTVMEAKLEKHEASVEEKIDAIHDRIDGINKRLDNFIRSVDSWMNKTPDALMDKCEKLLDEAIPHHPENPDASPAEKRHEHRRAHAAWIKRVSEEMQEWQSIRQKVSEWAIIGGLAFVVIAVWKLFLEGPK